MKLRNKVVVITGASSGIGKATAIKFARKGAKIVLAARRTEKLDELKQYIKKFNKNCIYVKTDVTKEKEVKNLFDQAENEFGTIHILINNAGKGLKAKLREIEFDEWVSVMNTNLTSVFLCTKEASDRMIRKKIKGHIITISSIAGVFNVPGYSCYCSSKHAVSSFKSSIKWELRRHGIKVSTIHPYKVDTEFFDIYKKRPNRSEMLSPRDIADYLVAIAERKPIKRISIKLLNIFKRIYYFLRYSTK